MIPWSRKMLISAFLSVAVISAGLTALVSLPQGPRDGAGPQHWLAFSEPSLEGDPQQNRSEIWRAVIRNVSTEEPFSSYRAGLLRNGQVHLEPVPLRPGTLGIARNETSGPWRDLYFDFFDSGVGCYPTPCPPPEGPDGLLNLDDYFRLSGVAPGAEYLIRVYWAETGEVAGEIAIRT